MAWICMGHLNGVKDAGSLLIIKACRRCCNHRFSVDWWFVTGFGFWKTEFFCSRLKGLQNPPSFCPVRFILMITLLIAVSAFVGYLVAYHTYGRWLSKKIFNLDPDAEVPSHQLRDNIDFVPTKKEVIFGHHFTSIAGTGPIVGQRQRGADPGPAAARPGAVIRHCFATVTSPNTTWTRLWQRIQTTPPKGSALSASA